MRKTFLTSALSVIVCITFAQNFILNSQGDYFGQTPPKDSAIIFAPGIVSEVNRYEYGLAISPNHDEVFFTAEGAEDSTQLTGLIRIKREGDKWTNPQKANLNQQNLWEQEAFFSPDGKKIYYAVYQNDSLKIWVSNKTGVSWTKGEILDSKINNSTKMIFYATLSNNLNLYYADVTKRKIMMAEIQNGKYDKIVDPGISRGGHPFISPDESFMLLNASGNDSFGKSDIYIVLRDNEGNWGEPINLGPKINSEYSETCPSLSPDGKYIFFGRYNDTNEKSNIYWISSDIIQELKP
jgi:Tol biopolymer transport system component